MNYTGTITQIIKDNFVRFVSLRATLDGNDYWATYEIGDLVNEAVNCYQFTVPLSDIGTGTLKATDKAIYYMRWIRKAMDKGEFVFTRQIGVAP